MQHGKTHYPITMLGLFVLQFFALAFVFGAAADPPPDPERLWISYETHFWVHCLPAFGAICTVALYWGVAGDSSDLLCLLITAVALPVAFTLISYGTHKRFGPDVFAGAATPPDWKEWAGYTAVHLLHVGDVVDALHEYHVSFPVPRAETALPRGLLVAFNASAGVLLGVLLITCFRNDVREVGRALQAARKFVLVAGAGLLVAVGAIAATRGWAPADWVLWPADNLLRAVDVADAMQVYGVRLHGVEPDPRTGALAVAFRLAAGTYVLGWLSGLRLRRLGGWGLSVSALVDEVRHGRDPWAALRVLQARSPRRLGPFALVFAEPLDEDEVPDPAVRRAFFELLLRAATEPELVEGLWVETGSAEARRYPEHTSYCTNGTWQINLWHFVPPRLDDEDDAIAAAAVRLLAGLPAGTPRDNVVVRMTGILGHPVEHNGAKLTELSPGEGSWRQQWRAVQVLAAIGPEAAPATPALLAVYRDPEAPAKLRLAAAKALKSVNREEYARLPREKRRRG